MVGTLQQKANNLTFATVNKVLRDRFCDLLGITFIYYNFAICNGWKTESCNLVTLSYFYNLNLVLLITLG